jgi:hypothetical protein
MYKRRSRIDHVTPREESGASILFRIARLYGKSIEWLLTGSDGKAPTT